MQAQKCTVAEGRGLLSDYKFVQLRTVKSGSLLLKVMSRKLWGETPFQKHFGRADICYCFTTTACLDRQAEGGKRSSCFITDVQ